MIRTLAIVLALLVVDRALSCGVCVTFNGSSLSLPHPRAIEIAVATRKAIENKTLTQSPPSSWSRVNDDVFPKFAERVSNARISNLPPTLHVVLIDTGETIAVHCRSGRLFAERVPAGRDASGAVATTSRALRALIAGRIDFERSLNAGLVVVDAPTAGLSQLFAIK